MKASIRSVGAALALVAVISGCTAAPTIKQLPGTIERITAGDGASATAAMSADSGQFVVFLSASDDLPGGPTNDLDLFVRDRTAAVTTRITTNSSSRPCSPTISGDGRYVGFISAEDLGGSPSTLPAAYLWDRVTTTFTLVGSFTAETGCDRDNQELALSSDGSTVVFNDGGSLTAWDRATGVSTVVANGDGNYGALSVSGNGLYAAYVSTSTNFVGGPGAGAFLTNLSTTQQTRVSNFDSITQFPLATGVTDSGDVAVNLLYPVTGEEDLIARGVITYWVRSSGVTSYIVNDGRVNALVGVTPTGRHVGYLSVPAPLDTTPLDGTDPTFPVGGQARITDRFYNTTGYTAQGRIGAGEIVPGAITNDGNNLLFASNDNLSGTDNNGTSMDLFAWHRS